MWKIISMCRDSKVLFEELPKEALDKIEKILEAYSEERFEVIPPRYEDGEVNYYEEFELVVKDKSYHVDGREIALIRWYESWGEEVDYIIEIFKER